jgi:hypothetical protein
MKIAGICFCACAVLACGVAGAQQPSNGSSDSQAYENGSIANNVYTNECFGFSLPIPDGWHQNTQFVGADARAKHTTKGSLILLMILRQQTSSIALQATDATLYAPTVQEFVSNSLHEQVHLDQEHREVLKDTYSIDFGGKLFSRADYKQMMNQVPVYIAFVYTRFRGYYVGETIIAKSADGLKESASSLQHIAFLEDVPNSKCVMHGDDSSGSGGVM